MKTSHANEAPNMLFHFRGKEKKQVGEAVVIQGRIVHGGLGLEPRLTKKTRSWLELHKNHQKKPFVERQTKNQRPAKTVHPPRGGVPALETVSARRRQGNVKTVLKGTQHSVSEKQRSLPRIHFSRTLRWPKNPPHGKGGKSAGECLTVHVHNPGGLGGIRDFAVGNLQIIQNPRQKLTN